MFHVGDDGTMAPVIEPDRLNTRRQELPEVFAPNGAVFVARVPWYRENRTFYGPDTVAYEMPAERSVDVDTALDLALVETLLN
jgi:CMP-N-acetylneuraminic acid synthetase